MPKTSQPVPADFLTLYRHLAGMHAAIVSVHLSSGLSGTLQSAESAAKQVSSETGVPILIVDSRSGSAGEGLVVWAAAQAAQAGLSAQQCAAVAEAAAQSAQISIYVPTVEYFVRGGRLSPLRGRIAKLFRILPVLTVKDGKLTAGCKALGRSAARKRVLHEALRVARKAKQPMFVVSHSAAPHLAETARADILERHPDADVWITETAPAIGSHAGPGGVAVAVLDAGAIRDRIREEGTLGC